MFSLRVSHSEFDSTERELSERHSSIAGGEALHSSLPPSPPLFSVILCVSAILSIDSQRCLTVPDLLLQYYPLTVRAPTLDLFHTDFTLMVAMVARETHQHYFQWQGSVITK